MTQSPGISKPIERVLLVQHAGAPGGSVVSGRYLIEGLVSRGLAVHVAMVEPNPEVRRRYETAGAKVIDTPMVPLFRHTTAGWAHAGTPRACVFQMQAVWKQTRGVRRIRALIDSIKPDIVHLNSVTLALLARGLTGVNVPIVWHVREAPVAGYLGVRRRFLRESLLKCADEVIFLSASDRRAWVADLCGHVIPNVVRADRPSDARVREVLQEFKITRNDRVLVYLGGFEEIKGISPLIDAVPAVLQHYPTLKILAPGLVMKSPSTVMGRVARWGLARVGLKLKTDRIAHRISESQLAQVFLGVPFVNDVLPIIAAAELLIFPSMRPHFARPVVEAATAGVPAIGSDLGGVSDLIEDGVTGLLVAPNRPDMLARAIIRLLDKPEVARRMGSAAAEAASKRFNADAQLDAIIGIYASARKRHMGLANSKPAGRT